MWFSILGRQSDLSIAELEVKYKPPLITQLSKDVAVFETKSVNINRLGGSLKIGQIFSSQSADLGYATISETIIDSFNQKPSKKINIGISWYGITPNLKEVNKFALGLKKILKKSDIKSRIVPNKTAALSTAQVLHNRLDLDENREYIVITTKDQTYFGRTSGVQNIDAYRKRDHERPARDAKVGMLPPKLAQIMLNLAEAKSDETILDPFCGTGVVLQEALLIGAQAYGSDIAERMVRMTEENLMWLAGLHSIEAKNIHLEVADARSRKWMSPISKVVSEIYLGPPLFRLAKPDELEPIIKEVDNLVKDTLINLAHQLEPETKIVLAIPAWRNEQGFTLLPIIDQVTQLGYTRVSFKYVAANNLIYARDNQFVGRQLLVLSKD